ncbi:MAG: FAD-dependent thymidylate synthase [Clostridia bacterium]|nr:FAD-dependent thymidylate synthase [Clostridia bacterium]
MDVILMSYTTGALVVCETAAAICTAASNQRKALQHAVGSGHTSVLEHASYTFKITGLSRVALAQLTRHRLASFSVQSQRYVKMNSPEMVMPKSISESSFSQEAESSMRYMANLYQRMVEGGIPKEDARYIMPQAVTTELIVTMNARELHHFFSLRTCNRAQWEIRAVADKMLTLCREVSPTLFEDAGPGCVTGQCPEKKPCGHPRKSSDWEVGT